MLSAGGQVPVQTVAPASASALAMANPKPPSSATPATNARFPLRSILSMRTLSHEESCRHRDQLGMLHEGLREYAAQRPLALGNRVHGAGQPVEKAVVQAFERLLDPVVFQVILAQQAHPGRV